MKKTLLAFVLLISLNSFSADLINPSWSSTNLTPGAIGTYTFNYTIVTANPNMICYAHFGSGFNADINTAVVTLNGSPATINFANSWGGSSMVIKLINSAAATAGTNVVVTVNVTNKSTAGTTNWLFIQTSTSGGNVIDGFPSPPPIVLTALSTPEIGYKNSVGVFPNPANNQLTITLDNATDVNRFFLVNQLGQVVKQWDMNQSKSKSFDLTELLEGLYILKAENFDYKSFSKQIIIRH